jgi:hypothetical protein
MPKFTSKTLSQDTAIFASSDGEALHGESTSRGFAAIAGFQINGSGTGAGVFGESRGTGPGVIGLNEILLDPGPTGPGGPGGPGGIFKSEQKEGIHVESKSLDQAAIAAYLNNPNGTGAAIYAEHILGVDGTAGFFRGNVIVTGDISLPGADFAEDFTIDDEAVAEAGTVMCLNGNGALVPCVEPYEKKVVGVVAGAGSHRTGIIMDKQEGSTCRRQPIALVGKVYCKVDASHGAIAVGDLLTTSATPGHAMKASDAARAFGAVLGKAMAPHSDGCGLIPILISLQ